MPNKLSKQNIEEEFYKFTKKNKLRWKFKKAVHQKYRLKGKILKYGRTWRIFFECEFGHKDDASFSNLKKRKTCAKCAGWGLTKLEKIKILNNQHNHFYSYKDFLKYGEKNIKGKLKIPIICPNHGLFYQKYSEHKNGKGCWDCAGTKARTGAQVLNLVKTQSKGLIDVKNIDINKTYTSSDKIEIKCKVHYWHPSSFRKLREITKRSSVTCKFCSASSYALRAYYALHQNGIKFDVEFPIKLSNGTQGFIDIVLIDKKGKSTFIEIDGEQHFNLGNMWQKNLKLRTRQSKSLKIRDRLKNDYAKKNNIRLYRIKYSEDIEKKITQIIKENNFTKSSKKNIQFPIGQIRDGEAKAYEVHKLFMNGQKPKFIKKKMNMIGSQVSKILHGTRYKNLFLHLYPEGINTNYTSKKPVRFKFSRVEKKFLISLIKKQQHLYPEVKKIFDKKFGKKILINTIKNLAKNLKIISPHWIKLNEGHVKIMKNMRLSGTSLKSISDHFKNNLHIKISRPMVKKYLDR